MKSRAGARKSRGTGAGSDQRRQARVAANAAAESPSAGSASSRKRGRGKAADASNFCAHCELDLTTIPKALYVEEEVGRVFCSEDCITSHFQPEIQKLEKEYLRYRPASDLSEADRERLDHLRWMTLEQPDEVWCEKTLTGDQRYTVISEFAPDNRRVWSVCVCLFLRGEPSFLFVSFPTTSRALVDRFRRGERIEWAKTGGGGEGPSRKSIRKGGAAVAGRGARGPASKSDGGAQDASSVAAEGGSEVAMDGLAGDWTVEETVRARMLRSRRKGDIQPDQFELFEACLQETIESPEEVWSMPLGKALGAFDPSAATSDAATDADEGSLAGDADADVDSEDDADPVTGGLVYVFIKSYTQEARAYWYVAIARDTEEEGQIEVIESFPTRDKGLVDRLRSGTQEYGDDNDLPVYSRMVH